MVILVVAHMVFLALLAPPTLNHTMQLWCDIQMKCGSRSKRLPEHHFEGILRRIFQFAYRIYLCYLFFDRKAGLIYSAPLGSKSFENFVNSLKVKWLFVWFRFQSSVFVIFCRVTTIHSRYLARLKSPSAILNGTFHSTLLTHCSVHSSSTHPALWSDQRMRLELCRHDLFPQIILYTRRDVIQHAKALRPVTSLNGLAGPVCARGRPLRGRVSCGGHRLAERAHQSRARRRTAFHVRSRSARARHVGQQAIRTRRSSVAACGELWNEVFALRCYLAIYFISFLPQSTVN